MKPMSLEKAKATYINVIIAEIHRCNVMIECIMETIKEDGKDEELVTLLNEIIAEKEAWKTGLE